MTWDESKHRRGQPENAGQFGPGGGHARDTSGGGRAGRRAVANVNGRDPRLPASGSTIRKAWRGMDVEIRVGENGFEWNGKQYKSLSRIAWEINGGKPVNGFLFFGLNKQTPKVDQPPAEKIQHPKVEAKNPAQTATGLSEHYGREGKGTTKERNARAVSRMESLGVKVEKIPENAPAHVTELAADAFELVKSRGVDVSGIRVDSFGDGSLRHKDPMATFASADEEIPRITIVYDGEWGDSRLEASNRRSSDGPKDQGGSGWSSTPDPEDVFVHEIGHIVQQRELAKAAGPARGALASISRRTNQWTAYEADIGAMGATRKKDNWGHDVSWPDGKPPKGSSIYSMSSPHEFFAETFASVIRGSPVDNRVMDVYKRMGGFIPSTRAASTDASSK